MKKAAIAATKHKTPTKGHYLITQSAKNPTFAPSRKSVTSAANTEGGSKHVYASAAVKRNQKRAISGVKQPGPDI